MIAPGNESTIVIHLEETLTGNATTAGGSAAAVTVAAVAAAGVKTALETETESGTETETAADHDLAHAVAQEAEVETEILESRNTSTVGQNVQREQPLMATPPLLFLL